MSNFIKAMQQESALKLTENGALAQNTSGENLVDLYSTIGASRNKPEKDLVDLFLRAYGDNPLAALRILFYARDIRGGLGERETFRTIVRYLANCPDKKENLKVNLHLFAEYGRWDDLYSLVGTDLEEDAFAVLLNQFTIDLDNMENKKPISVLGKWLKSTNTSSTESRKLGRLTAKKFGLSERYYRKALSSLRKYIDVTEVKMSNGDFDSIDFSKVPSIAMHKYQEAFKRRSPELYEKYIKDLSEGKSKINASTLYPYNIVENAVNGYKRISEQDELQWKALPNYVEGENNFVIMADVSGSMYGRPMATSVGLAIYFAERNKGAFHNTFMTFTGNPTFVTLKDSWSLADKVRHTLKADWGMNTNLTAAFRQILNVAVKNNISKEEMPKALIVVSDMEIDSCTQNNDRRFYDVMKSEYNENGYDLPTLVFWNVDSRNDTFLASADDKGVLLASGQSASVFKSLCSGITKTALELVMETVNSERYSAIKLAE